MFVSKIFSRVSRTSLNQYCRGISSSSRNTLPQIFTSDSILLVSGQSTNNKYWVPCQVNHAMHNNNMLFTRSTASQQFWYSSSSASPPQPNEKENSKSKKAKAETSKVDDHDDAELKVFAIQSFVKGLLDVADNLGRASSVVKDSFAKIEDSSKDTSVPLLQGGSEYQNMEKSLEEIKELLKVLTESFKNKSEEEDKYTVEICKGIVDDEGKDLFRYYVEEYCHVLKSFEKKEWREIFFSLSKEQRRVWMRSVKDNWFHTPKTYLI